MIFNKINSKKYNSLKAILSCFLITSFITTFSSCMTTSETFYATSDTLSTGSYDDITKIFLKNGSVINIEDNIFETGRESDSTLYFMIWTRDNERSGSGSDQNVINWSKKKISGNEIQKIQLKNSTVNVPLTLLVIGGSVLVLGIIYAVSTLDFSVKWQR